MNGSERYPNTSTVVPGSTWRRRNESPPMIDGWIVGVAGSIYLATAIALGIFVLVQGLPGVRTGTTKWARNVFLASIVYLPLLFAVMVFDGRA